MKGDKDSAIKEHLLFIIYITTVATKELFFKFNKKFNKQIDGAANMVPLANIFMCSFENKWLKDCPNSLRPVFYRRYVDDIFVLFFSLDQAEKFKKYLSSKHPNINFLLEKENDGRSSFLDIHIFRVKGKFVTYVIGKRPSVVFILISTASYLKPIKLV